VLCLVGVCIFALALSSRTDVATTKELVRELLKEREPLSQIAPELLQWKGLEGSNEALKAGHPSQALTLINDVIAGFEKGVPELPGHRSKAYITRARINLELKRYADVVNDCNEIEQDGLDQNLLSMLHDLRGTALLRLNQNAEAAVDFSRCIGLHPDWIWCYEGLSAANLGLKQYKEASESATQGLGIDPNRVALLKVRYVAYSGLGADEDAARDKKKLEDLNAFNLVAPRLHEK
jgi:tetratricopeptide (TPR) repeat protein